MQESTLLSRMRVQLLMLCLTGFNVAKKTTSQNIVRTTFVAHHKADCVSLVL